MKKFLIYNLVLITTVLYPTTAALAADETDFFPSSQETVQFGGTEETITTDANEFIFDNDNTATSGDQIQLQFGATINEYLQYDVTSTNFELSDDLDIEGNQLIDFRVENASSDPGTCSAALNGRLFFNTTDNKLYMCDGTSWSEVGSGGTAATDLAAVQARRTTNYTLTTSFVDVTFDTTDFENDATVVEHDNTNTDQIDIKEDGVYMITYRTSVEFPPGGSDNLVSAYGQLRVNDTSVIPGSEAEIYIWYDSIHTLTATSIDTFSAGDHISLQMSKNATTDTMTAIDDIVLQVTKMEGITGPQGPTGAGSTVIMQDEGSSIPNTPHSTLNFVGSGVTVTDAGSSVATITIANALDLTNIVYVDSTRPAQTGEVYATLAAAVAYVNTQSPSAANPWVIKVEPGSNSESVTLPFATVLVGEDKSKNEFTGTLTMSNGGAIQDITIGTGGMITIPSGSSGTINNSDVILNDGGDGVDGALTVSSSWIDGAISGTGAITAYNSTIGTTSYTTAGTLETYNSSVLNITDTGTWLNYGVAYDTTQLSAANQLNGSTTQSAIDELVMGTPADDFTLNENQTVAEDVTLTFGNISNEIFEWRNTLAYFYISDDLLVEGLLGINGNTMYLDYNNAGSGANVDIIAEQGTDNNGTIRYNATNNRWEISNDGGTFAAISTGGGSTLNLDDAYNNFGSSPSTINIDANEGQTGGLTFDGSLAGDETVTILNSGNGGGLLVENTGTGDSFRVNDQASDTTPFIIQNDGSVGIGTASPNEALDVAGNIDQYGTIFTLDADNTGSGANTDIISEQGTDSNGVIRYNASTNQWEISNNGNGYVPLAGWLGSQTRIKITPMDFQSDDADDNLDMASDGDYHMETGSADPVGTFAIPTGYRATHVMIYGSDGGNSVNVYENEIDDGNSATLLGTGTVDTEIDITDTDSTSLNYVSIFINIGNNDQIHGGYITIEPIP